MKSQALPLSHLLPPPEKQPRAIWNVPTYGEDLLGRDSEVSRGERCRRKGAHHHLWIRKRMWPLWGPVLHSKGSWEVGSQALCMRRHRAAQLQEEREKEKQPCSAACVP